MNEKYVKLSDLYQIIEPELTFEMLDKINNAAFVINDWKKTMKNYEWIKLTEENRPDSCKPVLVTCVAIDPMGIVPEYRFTVSAVCYGNGGSNELINYTDNFGNNWHINDIEVENYEHIMYWANYPEPCAKKRR